MTKHTGTGHPRPVTIRTAKTADAFLEALADKGSVTAAALAVHVSRVSLYAWRNEDAEFRTRWDEALELGLSKLEDVAAERALGGMSDTLLIFLLKARRGYRDTIYSRVAGEDGGPIRTQVDLTDPAAVNDRIRALLSRAQGAADA